MFCLAEGAEEGNDEEKTDVKDGSEDQETEQQQGVTPKEVLKKAKVEDDEYKESGGGEKNYYFIAHTIKEEVYEQPNILVNGKLKEYQVKVMRMRF